VKTAKKHRPRLTPEAVVAIYIEALMADAFEGPGELMEYLLSEKGWHGIMLGWLEVNVGSRQLPR